MTTATLTLFRVQTRIQTWPIGVLLVGSFVILLSGLAVIGIPTGYALPNATSVDCATHNPEEVLEGVLDTQRKAKNHHIQYETWYGTEKNEDSGHHKMSRICYEGDLRLDTESRRRDAPKKRLLVIYANGLIKSWNTWQETAHLGSIKASDPEIRALGISGDYLAPWLFGLVWGDTRPVWELMVDHVDCLSATETNVDGVRRFLLSATLPSGSYTLEVEPDFDFRLRRLSYDKRHSAGHFPPIRDEDLEWFPKGTDHLYEFISGTFLVESFQRVDSYWYPMEASFQGRSQLSYRPGPESGNHLVRVNQVAFLDTAPPEGTFVMEWPPYCTLSDHTKIVEGEQPPVFYADNEGTLRSLIELKEGDPLPVFPETGWLDEIERIDFKSVLGKWLFVVDWATWCGPCVHNLPLFQEAYSELKSDTNLICFGINSYDSPAQITVFMIEKGIDFPQLVGDSAQEAKILLGVSGAGSNFLFGPDGKVVARNIDEKQLRDILGKREEE
jgi:thiol-disulfide isomerase/thioredoxin